MADSPPVDEAPCANCGREKTEHRLVNYADGPHIGEPALICPRNVYQPEPSVFGFYCAPCGVTHRLADTVRRHATLHKLPRLET